MLLRVVSFLLYSKQEFLLNCGAKVVLYFQSRFTFSVRIESLLNIFVRNANIATDLRRNLWLKSGQPEAVDCQLSVVARLFCPSTYYVVALAVGQDDIYMSVFYHLARVPLFLNFYLVNIGNHDSIGSCCPIGNLR